MGLRFRPAHLTSSLECTTTSGRDIRARVAHLQFRLHEAGVPLRLVVGADVHMTPNLVAKLRSGEALTLGDTRYVLIEPPHHVLPPRTEDVFFDLTAAGFVPILTHPERMSWIGHRYDVGEAACRSRRLDAAHRRCVNRTFRKQGAILVGTDAG